MPKVTFVSADGAGTTVVDCDSGTSVMRAAQINGVAGVYAECGGQLACATCHVYVSEDDADRLSAVSEDEDEMLEATASDRLPNSRLSCQIILSDELPEVRVQLPEFQR